jgi:hypothetical protein
MMQGAGYYGQLPASTFLIDKNTQLDGARTASSMPLGLFPSGGLALTGSAPDATALPWWLLLALEERAGSAFAALQHTYHAYTKSNVEVAWDGGDGGRGRGRELPR